MNFSTDRDLLTLEPSLFSDIPLAGQELLRAADATLSDTTLTSASSDFLSAGVGAGCVALADRVPLEVVARVDAHTLTVSALRSSGAAVAPSLPPTTASAREIIVRTFHPQATATHDELLRMIGIDPESPDPRPGEDAIVSRSAMRNLESLGTLERVFTAAATPQNAQPEMRAKAEHYALRYRRACLSAVVWLDLDGDGRGDTIRHPGVASLVRR